VSIAVVAATLFAVAALTPQQKASLLVVSGLPAPAGVGGVIVHRYDRWDPRPRGAFVFADQEGGVTRSFPELPPARAAATYVKPGDAFAAGRATGLALRRAGVDVDLAPVLDLATGPLGRRHFRHPALGVAFARGLAAGRTASCAKHFPGLGSARFSTDDRPHVDAVLQARELAGFRVAVAAGVPCVMVDHAFYRSLGRRRASLEPATYRLLRGMGFDGVAITDSLSIVRRPPADWPVRAARAGADLLLVPSPSQAGRAIRALVPLARRGELDRHVERVLLFRSHLGR
jgi:beta-N-acetylhexosaminidase